MSFSDSRFQPLRSDGKWRNAESDLPSVAWICGYCNNKVASDRGYPTDWPGNTSTTAYCIRICPNCKGPTFFIADGGYSPSSLPGSPVEHVPADLAALFHEARTSAAAGANTASVMVCRKMLMHIAVEKGAEAGGKFQSYVEYLAAKGYVPPGGRGLG